MNTRQRRSATALSTTTVLLLLATLTGCSLSPAHGRAQTPAADSGTGTCEFTATRDSADPDNPQNTALFTVTLTNTGSTSCTVTGFPDVALLDATGNAINDPVTTRDTIPAHTITVKPHDAAYLQVAVAGRNLYPDCPLLGAASLRIALPQSSTNILVDVTDLNICDAATSGWLIYNLTATPTNPHS
ncbi:DUF4232 domain-containing protein [Cryobacterium arcticum]|uniref:DUF4232 domain-containing protein n=1 Tax=Cryobacterium arcticum TaxID=670052 RepID=A0A1B1BQR0_9MICO|nr:DUF4232 domain-containing protein [Cryobacterium arcticum]ANP74915.1 hypothetical protein PA27867_4009 [Cryobacterium arcticum]